MPAHTSKAMSHMKFIDFFRTNLDDENFPAHDEKKVSGNIAFKYEVKLIKVKGL